MAYVLLAATGTTDAQGRTTFTNRPANAVGLATLDADGKRVPVPEAAFTTPATPGGPTYTAGTGIAISPTNEISVPGLASKADLVGGKVPAAQLPSYVDDVLEFANLAAFPATGETGKIYVALDSNKQYRWSGSAYQVLSDSGLTQAQVATLTAVAAPVRGLVGGVVQGYATLEAAIAAAPTVISLKNDVTVSATTASRFGGLLLANGRTITVGDGAQLRLGRYTLLKDAFIIAPGTGTVGIVSGGIPGPGAMPAPDECVQLVDSRIEAPLSLAAINNYQGLALRGNSTVTNLASGGGPVYLFDLAEVSQPLPAGFTVYDKRPGAGVPASSSMLPLTATRTTDYTLALADAGCLVPVSAASPVTVTVPAHADVAFPVGTTLYVAQDGAGTVTVAWASGVVVQTAGGYKVGAQWLDVALHKRDLNTWVLKGGVL